jgi:hypothetical protein
MCKNRRGSALAHSKYAVRKITCASNLKTDRAVAF